MTETMTQVGLMLLKILRQQQLGVKPLLEFLGHESHGSSYTTLCNMAASRETRRRPTVEVQAGGRRTFSKFNVHEDR